MKTMPISRNAILFVAGLTASGCAVKNQYAYDQAKPELIASGTQSVAVATLDQRPYVVAGSKTPDFVGLQRGGFGNPFSVTTASGNAMADDLTTAIVSALDVQGFTVQSIATTAGNASEDTVQQLVATGAGKLVLLTMNELKSDTLVNVRYAYDMTLQVFDANGTKLAQTRAHGEETLGGSVFNPMKVATENVPKAAQSTLETLFNAPAVVKALGE
jgi:hypothetical protein